MPSNQWPLNIWLRANGVQKQQQLFNLCRFISALRTRHVSHFSHHFVICLRFYHPMNYLTLIHLQRTVWILSANTSGTERHLYS